MLASGSALKLCPSIGVLPQTNENQFAPGETSASESALIVLIRRGSNLS